MSVRVWQLRAHTGAALPLDRPHILAILNVTPDSFSDGGELPSPSAVVARAMRVLEEGASMLDIGAESTRPGAERVPADEQIARAVPAIEAIRAAGIDAPISIDTTRADVARAALDASADAINDVSGATEDPGLLPLAAERGCAVILMHRLRPPDADRYSDQYTRDAPTYEGGVVHAVRTALEACAQRALDAGVAPESIVLDPGLGFGKTVDQNLALVRATRELEAIGYPTLGAASRKSFVGKLTGVPEARERVIGSVAFALAQFRAGVRLFRVHDVEPHRQALAVARALDAESPVTPAQIASEQA